MRIPERLKKGDKVTIVAPARKVTESELAPAIEVLQSWGLKVVINPLLWRVDRQFAGTDMERAGLLQWAINSAEIKAVFCARGGYGTVRMIDFVDFGALQEHPKWICGFSDITVLLSHLNNLGLASLHSTMPLLFQQSGAERAMTTLRKTLFDSPEEYTISNVNPLNRYGIVEGELCGGNLSVLYSLMNSRSFPNLEGKILFLEDLDEYLYHIDRMLQGIRRSGAIDNILALIVGGMSDMHDNEIPFGMTVNEIISSTVKDLNIPVVFDFPIGHIENNNAVIVGGNYRLVSSKEGVTLKPSV